VGYEITQEELASLKRSKERPHVVILGAGASLAACPNGDAYGKPLPIMNNLVETLGLGDLIAQARYNPAEGFEALYSRLHAADPHSPLVAQIEQRVKGYFTQLLLPKFPTIYDLLVLSLRKKDAIFTFNWDPFLVDAWERNADIGSLPQIFHLHGNVRVSFCTRCGKEMRKAEPCRTCGNPPTPSRLLYPVAQKNYADDPFIASQWQQARDFIGRAFIITIFGYSAPTTDKEAMEIFTKAWKQDSSHKHIERVEIIDIRDGEELGHQWGPFAHFDHRDMCRNFHESRLACYPRRTCEALCHEGFDGKFVEPITRAGSLEGLKASVADLVEHENRTHESQ
jgi:hypothetical protein